MYQRMISAVIGVSVAAALSACSQSETVANTEEEVTDADVEQATQEFEDTVDQIAGEINKTVEEAGASITEANADEALTELEQLFEDEK